MDIQTDTVAETALHSLKRAVNSVLDPKITSACAKREILLDAMMKSALATATEYLDHVQRLAGDKLYHQRPCVSIIGFGAVGSRLFQVLSASDRWRFMIATRTVTPAVAALASDSVRVTTDLDLAVVSAQLLFIATPRVQLIDVYPTVGAKLRELQQRFILAHGRVLSDVVTQPYPFPDTAVSATFIPPPLVLCCAAAVPRARLLKLLGYAPDDEDPAGVFTLSPDPPAVGAYLRSVITDLWAAAALETDIEDGLGDLDGLEAVSRVLLGG